MDINKNCQNLRIFNILKVFADFQFGSKAGIIITYLYNALNLNTAINGYFSHYFLLVTYDCIIV